MVKDVMKVRLMREFPVVVADDDASTLRLLEARLNRSGFKVFTCTGGDEALILVQRHKPVILLADWEMPGITGPELCRRIRESELSESVHAILITGNAEPEEIAVGLDAGANDYLVKPVHSTVMLARVRAGERVLQLWMRQREYALDLESEIAKRKRSEDATAARTAELEQQTIELKKSHRVAMGMMEDAEQARKGAEAAREALRGAKVYTDNIISSMIDMLVVVAPDGTIRTANEATCNALGYPVEELIGRPASLLFSEEEEEEEEEEEDTAQSIVSQEALPFKRTTLRRLVKEGSISNVEKSYLTKSGNKIPVLMSGSVMRDDDGQIRGIVCVAQDITERKEAEAALAKSEQKFMDCFFNSPDATLLIDGETFVDCNQKTVEMLGASNKKEVLATHPSALSPETQPDGRSSFEKANEMIATAFERGSNRFEWDHRRLDGEVFPVEVTLVPVPLFGKQMLYCMWKDITTHKLAEERLRKLSVAVEQSPASVVITDTRGTIEYVNPRFCEVTGYTAEEAVGQNPRILKGGKKPKESYKKLWDTILAGKIWTGAFENRKKSGELYWEEASICPIRDASGSVTHFLAVKQDITERKKAEESLRKTESELRKHRDHLEELVSERTAELAKINDSLVCEVAERRVAERVAAAASSAKGDFLATMSHELRTPLNGIIGMTELLLGSGLTREQKRQAGLVKVSGDILLRLINDILDFSKIEAGRLELEITDFNLRDTIECVATLLRPQAEKKELELSIRVNPAVPTAVRGDPGRLQQILTNLVSNAIKFTKEGQVVIRAVVDDENESSVSVRISVTDTGIGIPADKQEFLFQSFSQLDASHSRRFGGTGLGLAISKQLVEMMGGEIGAISETGSGSTFWFFVTLEKGRGTGRPLLIPHDSRLVRVLAVDDNATSREILDEQLTSFGIRHELAPDGERALTTLRDAAATDTPFALVLVDLQMPDMDGEQFAQVVKSDPCIGDTVLLLLTSAGIIGNDERMRALGFSAWLPKPIRQSQLFDAITQALACARVNASYELKETADSNRPSTQQRRTTDARILAAEDNAIGQEVLKQVLSQAGYVHEIVATGREAVDAWRAGGVDLILMDCQMPEMDGFEATREIRHIEKEEVNDASATRRIPIVALTANALEGDREKCLDAGMDDHIAKPFDPAKLIEAIESKLADTEKQEMTSLDSGSSDRVCDDLTSDSQGGGCADDAPPPFDMDTVLKRWGGDRDFVQKLIDKFLADAPPQLAKLTQHVADDDIAEATCLAHGLKGAAAYCGAERFRKVAARLEEMGRAGNLNGADECLDELRCELDRCLGHTPATVGPDDNTVRSNH